MKVLKRRSGKRTLCGFSDGVTVYGKTFFDKFSLETKWDLGLFKSPDTTICLYRKDKKPKFRFIRVISVVMVLLFPVILVTAFTGALLKIYFSGLRNFVKDSAWQDNVREFTWATIVLLLLTWSYLIYLKISGW